MPLPGVGKAKALTKVCKAKALIKLSKPRHIKLVKL